MEPPAEQDPRRADVDAMLVRCQDRLRTRIRWMMGEQVRRQADSGDFVGDVTARILSTPDLVWRDEAHFLAIATRIARNAIVDRARRPRIQRFESFTANLSAGKMADLDAETPSEALAQDEDIDSVLAALETLSEEHQRVIELRHFEGLPFKQIADHMGSSERAVQSLHARAITRLGRALS